MCKAEVNMTNLTTGETTSFKATDNQDRIAKGVFMTAARVAKNKGYSLSDEVNVDYNIEEDDEWLDHDECNILVSDLLKYLVKSK